ncbi:hypothetical protein C7T35_10080 [Variovorax sp. WS11]|uniref:three component ABC system middle component n=1 Tax=Variovorax sp. WS11 TaxID=1105204 RepID=UPI000D0D6599|nr:three component ABC system middle component [Variovorax sp. WS11]NDZ12698.1 hypothetical protein [Variovorax sp. WS11]PSL84643.1 hypothetical protein C7T35_10080 [Variovorax sp. WS11]
MKVAHDIHAETNPAFCAVVLAQFCEAHQQHLERKAALVTAYLVLPIALSEDLAATFEGCNKSTGLLVWLERSPRVLSGLSGRVNATLAVTTEAIRFGCIAGLLRLEAEASIASANTKMPPAVVAGIAGSALKRARLLGSWFSGAGSARAVIEAMGVSV